jgi:hypothetical protein
VRLRLYSNGNPKLFRIWPKVLLGAKTYNELLVAVRGGGHNVSGKALSMTGS